MARDDDLWGRIARGMSDKSARDNPSMTKRPGRVLSVTEGAHITVGVHVAGDPEGVVTHATSTIGGLRIGEWVLVEFIPPRGTLVTGRVLADDVNCEAYQIPFSFPGTLTVSTSPPWRSDMNRTLDRVVALLSSTGTDPVEVGFNRDGVSIGTVTIPTSDLAGEAVGVGSPFYADTNLLTAAIIANGTGATDLTMIFYFRCGLIPALDVDEGGGE